MSEYRLDLVEDDDLEPLRSEHFEARGDTAAFRKAGKILAPLVTSPAQYGELYRRDGANSADYLGQVEPEGTS